MLYNKWEASYKYLPLCISESRISYPLWRARFCAGRSGQLALYGCDWLRSDPLLEERVRLVQELRDHRLLLFARLAKAAQEGVLRLADRKGL